MKQKAVRRQYIINRGTERSKKYSGYPYIVTASGFRKNIYLTATDLRGRVKLFGNPGRLGYKGSDKKQFIVVLAVAQKFFKKLLSFKIRNIFLKFKNFRRTQLLGKTNCYFNRFKRKYRPSGRLLPNKIKMILVKFKSKNLRHYLQNITICRLTAMKAVGKERCLNH